MLLENTMNKWDDAERLRQVMSEKNNEKNIMDGAGFKTNPFDEYLLCFFSAIAEEGAIYCTMRETHYGLKQC